MVKMVIKNPDGSEYWKDTFPTMAACSAWLDEEKTRKYWNLGFVVELEDKTKEVEAEAALRKQEREQRTAVRVLLVSDLKALKEKKGKSQADLILFIEKLSELVGI